MAVNDHSELLINKEAAKVEGCKVTEESRKILFADDEALIRKFLPKILKGLISGFDELTAGNGQEAIDIIKQERPGLVILDLMMPIKTGLDVLLECQDEIRSGMIVIVVSGGVLPSYKKSPENVFGLGAKEIVEKPFSKDELREAVKRHLL